MAEALDKASEKTEGEAPRRKTRNDNKANDTNLPVGARVFLRNRDSKGRNKIQDVWKATPHKVVERLNTGGNTYVVEPLIGEPLRKTVHTRD